MFIQPLLVVNTTNLESVVGPCSFSIIKFTRQNADCKVHQSFYRALAIWKSCWLCLCYDMARIYAVYCLLLPPCHLRTLPGNEALGPVSKYLLGCSGYHSVRGQAFLDLTETLLMLTFYADGMSLW